MLFLIFDLFAIHIATRDTPERRLAAGFVSAIRDSLKAAPRYSAARCSGDKSRLKIGAPSRGARRSAGLRPGASVEADFVKNHDARELLPTWEGRIPLRPQLLGGTCPSRTIHCGQRWNAALPRSSLREGGLPPVCRQAGVRP
jgi:hypothetical protein